MHNKQTITIATQERFQRSIFNPPPLPHDFDEIDHEIDEHLVIDPYVSGAPSRRSDKELARILDLIDSLPVSSTGKEGQA